VTINCPACDDVELVLIDAIITGGPVNFGGVLYTCPSCKGNYHTEETDDKNTILIQKKMEGGK
jgi:hypothetical protein